MPKKKKKKLIILIVIISILLVLLITGGVCAYLYINTDMLKSNQTLFEKYLAQNISIAKEFIDRNPEEMLDILERNKYTSNMTIKAVFTNGIGTTDENKNNTINNASLNINSQVDKANNYNYKNIRLAYETQDLAKMEMNSLNTLLTVPVPRMIWSCPDASNTPFTPSTFSMASLSALLLSAITRRSLVAQWAADTMFLLPPTRSRIDCAVFL